MNATDGSATYFESEGIVIYNEDMLKVSAIPDASVDLIVTSPPYNVDIRYNSHQDGASYDEYLAFMERSLEKCYRLARDAGRLCLNIPLDKNKGGQQSVCADITTIAKRVGWRYHATIIWNEGTISRRTAWGSWLSASAPYVIAPVEVIVVLYKMVWKKSGGSGRNDITKEEFMDWTNGVWAFPGQNRRGAGGHPAPFPVELPRRCIKLFSFVGDTVLDPFMGSGSTLIATHQNNRKGIGIDIDSGYCDIAVSRLKNDKAMNEKDKRSIRDIIKEYFIAHPHEDVNSSIVSDHVKVEYPKEHNRPARDPMREIRKLHEEGFLIKVDKGIYRYKPTS